MPGTTNPNRVTIYTTPSDIDQAQELADVLTKQGVKEIVGNDGKVKHSALYRHLVKSRLKHIGKAKTEDD